MDTSLDEETWEEPLKMVYEDENKEPSESMDWNKDTAHPSKDDIVIQRGEKRRQSKSSKLIVKGEQGQSLFWDGGEAEIIM